LAMEEPPIVLPRDIVSCRFPLVDGAGNSRHQSGRRLDRSLCSGQSPDLGGV
jgi:hypothetical protein